MEARTFDAGFKQRIVSSQRRTNHCNLPQDIVLGLYYMTATVINAKGEGSLFADVKEVHRAYHTKQVELGTEITVRLHEW